jgi:hypothetical protein
MLFVSLLRSPRALDWVTPCVTMTHSREHAAADHHGNRMLPTQWTKRCCLLSNVKHMRGTAPLPNTLSTHDAHTRGDGCGPAEE